MTTNLDQILSTVRQRVEVCRKEVPDEELSARAQAMRPARGFRKTLEFASRQGPAVIAELKKASPSRGALRGSYPVGMLANQYRQGGAVALSVLTEETYFQGSLQHLLEASAATDLPCLRKDFIVEEYQLLEARAHAADCVLLIAAALGDPEFGMLFRKAHELGMDVLCEVHTEAEVARAVAIGADLIGVNSRDLKTLEVDTQTHYRLAKLLPENALAVAESGIRGGADVRDLRAAGYSAFLIGESLITQPDPGAALAHLIGEAKAPPLGSLGVPGFRTGTKD